MLTMGFIGLGKSTHRYHLPYLRTRENITVKTIYNRSPKPATPETAGIHLTTDLDELLNDPAIQLVTIATPAATHYEFAKQVIEAGKHVIVEKPFAASVKEAKELLALAAEKDVMAMPYQNRRFDGDYLALKQVVERGYLGDVLEVEMHMDHFRPDQTAHVGPKEEGNFYGLGVHTIDRMLALFGRPTAVSYDIRSLRNPASVDDYFEADLFYGERLKVKVKTSFLVATPYPQVIAHGTQGSFIKFGEDQQENDLKAGIMPGVPDFGIDSPKNYGTLHYQNANGDWIDKQLPTPLGDYGRVYDAAYETIINGKAKLVSNAEILTNIEILENGFAKPSPSVYHLN